MRNFDQLDTSCFKSFYLAAEKLNFTEAARLSSSTQSGVSQHIARLESQLGVQLFFRVGRKLALTEEGHVLLEYIDQYLDNLSLLKEKISNENKNLEGYVKFAMPESCLMSNHFKQLLKERHKNFLKINLKVEICNTERVLYKTLNADIDFGFVEKKTSHPSLIFDFFSDEEYILIAYPGGKQFPLKSFEDIKRIPFVTHPELENSLSFWASKKFNEAHQLTCRDLNVVGEINSLHGALDMVLGKIGCSVLPRHCVDSLIKDRDIIEIKGPNSRKAVFESYIVMLKDRVPTRRVLEVVHEYKKMKKLK